MKARISLGLGLELPIHVVRFVLFILLYPSLILGTNRRYTEKRSQWSSDGIKPIWGIATAGKRRFMICRLKELHIDTHILITGSNILL